MPRRKKEQKKGSTLGDIARQHGNPKIGKLMDDHAKRTGKDQFDTSPQAGAKKRGPRNDG